MKQLDDDYQLTLFIYSGIAWVVLNLAFLPRRVGFIVDVLLLVWPVPVFVVLAALGVVKVEFTDDKARFRDLEHFSYFCRAVKGSLNQAIASSAVRSGSSSVMA